MTILAAALVPLLDAGETGAMSPTGRAGGVRVLEQGTSQCGLNGAGHFAKMVHNGIEYVVMAAHAEGLNVLYCADIRKRSRRADAETTPHGFGGHLELGAPHDKGESR
jgi:6-phosphogluconate dehydrogenase